MKKKKFMKNKCVNTKSIKSKHLDMLREGDSSYLLAQTIIVSKKKMLWSTSDIKDTIKKSPQTLEFI